MHGVLTRAQIAWVEALRGADAFVFIWRPCCWQSGELLEVLR